MCVCHLTRKRLFSLARLLFNYTFCAIVSTLGSQDASKVASPSCFARLRGFCGWFLERQRGGGRRGAVMWSNPLCVRSVLEFHSGSLFTPHCVIIITQPVTSVSVLMCKDPSEGFERKRLTTFGLFLLFFFLLTFTCFVIVFLSIVSHIFKSFPLDLLVFFSVPVLVFLASSPAGLTPLTSAETYCYARLAGRMCQARRSNK